MVEVQLLNERHFVLEQNISMVATRLRNFQIPSLNEEIIAGVIASLTERQKDPRKFPNILLFLDQEGQIVSIDEFIVQYKKSREKK